MLEGGQCTDAVNADSKLTIDRTDARDHRPCDYFRSEMTAMSSPFDSPPTAINARLGLMFLLRTLPGHSARFLPLLLSALPFCIFVMILLMVAARIV